MAGCCGGKNAGKPISRKRYWLGMGFFAAYHVAVQSMLSMAGAVSPRFKPVAAFHREYFRHIFSEAARREGVTLEGEECKLERNR